ncbi:tetratricopeptide repeat protein [Haloferula chungangensis]|uniref:Tetratricopeptide repeat protein n=1 Tax=Haloferula chungangensis TaxID=1048331 RepID=A0ABW2L2T4_9BACT
MTIADAIRRILNENGQSILRDHGRFRALIQDHCYDAPRGELHVTCFLLIENHVERFRVESLSLTERERIQNLLYVDYGFDREIVSRAIANWSSVLGSVSRAPIDPGDAEPETIAEAAESLNAKGSHGAAEDLLRQAISVHSSSALLHATLAEILAANGRLRDASSYIKKARELDPNNVDYVVYDAKLSLQHRENKNAHMK